MKTADNILSLSKCKVINNEIFCSKDKIDIFKIQSFTLKYYQKNCLFSSHS